jgi:hypothetical protein
MLTFAFCFYGKEIFSGESHIRIFRRAGTVISMNNHSVILHSNSALMTGQLPLRFMSSLF